MLKSIAIICKVSAVAIIASVAIAGVVELEPGTVEYDVSFEGGTETVTRAYAWAGSVDSSTSAYGNSTEFPFRLSVEGDESYKRHLRAHGDWGYVYIFRDAPVLVGAGATLEDDYFYDTSRVTADISVVGGTARSVGVYTSASEGQERYSGHKGQTLNASAGQVTTLMVADSSVRLTVRANMTTTDGTAVVRTLEKTVDLSAGKLTVPFEFDITDVSGSILQGTASIPSAFDGMFSRHLVQVYQGTWRAKSLQSNPETFAFSDLSAGNAGVYGHTYLGAPYYRIQHPSTNVTMPSGDSVTHDFVISEMGTAQASLLIDGFLDNSDLSHSALMAAGITGTATAGYAAEDRNYNDSAVLDLALPAGSWNTRYYDARFQNTSDPAHYMNAIVRATLYNQPSWSVANEAATDLGTIPITTVQTDLIFDVKEPNGVSDEYLITRPYIYGYANQYNGQNQLERQLRIDAGGSNEQYSTATLRVVAEPGVYQAYPRAYVYEPGNSTPTLVYFPPFELTMEAGYTPACPDTVDCPVEVVLANGNVVVTFDKVDVEGVTTVTTSPVGPEPPVGFKLYSTSGGLELYYYIQTSAIIPDKDEDSEFDVDVEICFHYPEGNTLGDEQSLSVGHYNSEGPDTGAWEVLKTVSNDTDNNIICVHTDSFSPFALLLPDGETSNGAPIADAGDDQHLTCVAPDEQIQISLDGSLSSDPDGDALSFEWSENGSSIATGETPTVLMSAGTHEVSLVVSDGSLTSEPDTVSITLDADEDAPGVEIADPLVLWPPNHQYHALSLEDCAALTQDVCEPGLDIGTAGRIVSIYSDEPENGARDGDTWNDIVIDDATSFRVRAERQGAGNGRVYGVEFVVEDSVGNTSELQTCFVHVPLCQSAQCLNVTDDGEVYVVHAP